jgi:hypothetical protein
VPDKVSDGGAHLSGVPVARGRSSIGRLSTSTPDIEVMADGDPGEVLRLGRGYAVVRHEQIWKRRCGCGGHRGGNGGGTSVRAAALPRSRPMHGLD